MSELWQRRVLSRATAVVLCMWAPAAFADYPCWRGEYGSGAGTDCGQPLVDTLADARLIWRSEARTYQAYPEPLVGRPNIYTGQAGPVMADGRVFFYYFMPDGRVYNKRAAEEFESRDFDPAVIGFDSKYEVGKRYYGVTAEDVLLCCDAKTGKTLWQRNIPGGMNYGGRRGGWAGTKAGPLLTPCAAYGKVFFVGSTFRVFALDAETGETVWENHLGPAYERIQAALKSAIDARDVWKLPVDWFLGGHAPTFADGVICSDDEEGGIYGGGLVAFDAETGKKLWSLPKESNSYPGPVRWVHKGREYFLSGCGALIEPRTGRILWTVGGRLLSANAEYLLTEVPKTDTQPYVWQCHRISPEKVELLWSNGKHGVWSAWKVPVILHDHVVWGHGTFNSLDLASGSRYQSISELVGTRTRTSLIGSDGIVLIENNDILRVAPDGTLTNGAFCKWNIPGHPGLVYCNTTTGCIDDGRWYFREADCLVCFQLRKDLHDRVRGAGGDTAALLALCGDSDPAVAVDAVVALRRAGDLSPRVIEALVACLGQSRFGAAAEAAKTLRSIQPPPPALFVAIGSGDRDLRLGALRSLSSLDGLPVKALAMAASEPRFSESEKAGRLLAERCQKDLTPMVDAIAGVSDDSVRGRLLALMRGNMNVGTRPGVVEAARVGLKNAAPDGAKGLLQVLAAVGNDEAWRLLASIVAEKSHPHRDMAVDALRRWPDEKPLNLADGILADKGGESTRTRTLALGVVLQSLEFTAARLPAKARADLFASRREVAKELGLEPQLLAALGRTKSRAAMKILGAYVDDRDLGENALEAMVSCGKELEYGDMKPAIVDLEVLLLKVKQADARETLGDLLGWIKRKHASTVPSVSSGGIDAGDDDGLGIDL